MLVKAFDDEILLLVELGDELLATGIAAIYKSKQLKC